MSLMIGWELKPGCILDEVGAKSKGFMTFYSVCIKFVVPVVMAFVLAGQMMDYFGGSSTVWYVVAVVILVVFWVVSLVGNKKTEKAK